MEFQDGEVILMHEFERRFKRAYCGGVEPHYLQWVVRVEVDRVGNVTLRLGRSLEEIKKDLEG